MEKEENIHKNTEQNLDEESQNTKINEANDSLNEDGEDKDQDQNTPETLEEKIIKLEDKVARTFAEMENQRRRFEKEKDEAYEYGGFAFAKEALNLIDNLESTAVGCHVTPTEWLHGPRFNITNWWWHSYLLKKGYAFDKVFLFGF